jgi:hypothetical protein
VAKNKFRNCSHFFQVASATTALRWIHKSIECSLCPSTI